MPRPQGAREIPMELRIAIVVMRIFFHLPFTEIATRLNLRPRAVHTIYQRAIARAGSTDFREIAACVGNLKRSGRPPRIIEGKSTSFQSRQLFAKSYKMIFEAVSKCLCGLQIGRSMHQRVACHYYTLDPSNPQPLVRRIQLLKPGLSLRSQRSTRY